MTSEVDSQKPGSRLVFNSVVTSARVSSRRSLQAAARNEYGTQEEAARVRVSSRRKLLESKRKRTEESCPSASETRRRSLKSRYRSDNTAATSTNNCGHHQNNRAGNLIPQPRHQPLVKKNC